MKEESLFLMILMILINFIGWALYYMGHQYGWVADIDSAEEGDVVAFDGLNGDDYVYTNIFDMLRWDRALREGKVLTSEEQQIMYTPGSFFYV